VRCVLSDYKCERFSMSKRFFCPLLWLLATALALSAQIKEGRPAAGSAALPASEEILKETSEIRGLRVI
jgi:hypothetical protein